MKKFACCLIAFAMVITMAAGCSADQNKNANAAASGNTTASIKVWMPPFGTADTLDKDFWTNTLKTFGDQNHADISVEIVSWGDYEAKWLTAISAGTGPDIGYMYSEMIGDYIKMGALQPLDSYITDADRENYIYLDKGVINGKQYHLPIIVGNPRLLYCNMDILKKSGFTKPPKTWDDLIAYGQKIAKDSPDKYPFLQGWGDPAIGGLNPDFYPYLWQAGGDLFSKDGKSIEFNKAAGLKAAQFLYDLRYKYKILPAEVTSLKLADVLNSMLDGKCAMAVMDSAAAKQLDDKKINWDFTMSLTDKTPGTFTVTDGLIMNSKCADKKLAADVMKDMTSGKVMSSFHSKLSMYPPIGKDEEYADNPKFKSMYESESKYFHSLMPLSGSSKVYDTLYKNLQLMMLNQLTPQKALDNTATYAKTVIGH